MIDDQGDVSIIPTLGTGMVQSKSHGGDEYDKTACSQIFVLIGGPSRHNVRCVGVEIVVAQT